MVRREQAGQNQLPLYENGLPELDRFQRIEILETVEGFLPTTKAEQVEVMSLLDYPPNMGGAARHIAEVSRRQHLKTSMEDPASTSRKLVRNYVDWMTDAYKSSHELAQLETDLKEVLNPELRLSRVFEPTQPGLLPFMRYYDLALLKITGDTEVIGYDPQKVSYTPDNGGIMYYLENALESWRVNQLKRKLPLAQAHESNRFVFFAERLHEVVKHSPNQLKAIANEGFDKLYDRTK